MFFHTSSKQASCGFTLVELVMVMVLIGILSALGVGLFARTDSFTPLTGRDLLLSTALLAQGRALANPDPAVAVTLTVSQTSSQWRFRVVQGTTSFDDRTAARSSSTQLLINGAVLADGGSQSISYATDGSTGANLAIRFQGDSARNLCIASTGFPYAGACQP